MDHCLPSAWNGSWNGAPDNPSAATAVSAMTCAIGAASALGARGRTSCKRQFIDSDPDVSQQARLAFFVVAWRDKRAHCNWLEQLQIAEYGREIYQRPVDHLDARSS
jgi:hypothetical protein